MKTIAFFNNKAGVGKTTLVYHLAWMFAERGVRTVVLDLDPQPDLTSMFLSKARLERLKKDFGQKHTVMSTIARSSLETSPGKMPVPHLEFIAQNLAFVPGDLGLACMEEKLNFQWRKCLEGDYEAFQITAIFYRLIRRASDEFGAHVALLDTEPNLSALTRSALIAADYVVMPLAPDLFSLQSLKKLGSTMAKWHEEWIRRLVDAPFVPDSKTLPSDQMKPAGYILIQKASRQNSSRRWAERFPSAYRAALNELEPSSKLLPEDDPNCLGQVNSYSELMPLALEARKPIFHLKPVDGTVSGQMTVVRGASWYFHDLTLKLTKAIGLDDLTNTLTE